jgi:hypothetical protein
MHPCLALPDITENIVSFLGLSNNDLISERGNHRDLLVAAMVCKTWLNPGLDELWRVQRSIVPLLKLLPEDSWEIRQPFEQIKTMVCADHEYHVSDTVSWILNLPFLLPVLPSPHPA